MSNIAGVRKIIDLKIDWLLRSIIFGFAWVILQAFVKLYSWIKRFQSLYMPFSWRSGLNTHLVLPTLVGPLTHILEQGSNGSRLCFPPLCHTSLKFVNLFTVDYSFLSQRFLFFFVFFLTRVLETYAWIGVAIAQKCNPEWVFSRSTHVISKITPS